MSPSKHHVQSPGPTGPGLERRLVVAERAQALGRLPWFAAFFLRARRLRPVLPMRSSYVGLLRESPTEPRTSSQVRRRDDESSVRRPEAVSRAG